MKYLLVLIVALALSANEMDRIESILKDIENIRAENASCVKSLKSQTSIHKTKQSLEEEIQKCKKLLQEEIAKNESLVIDLNSTKEYKRLLDIEQTKNKFLASDLNTTQEYKQTLEEEKEKNRSLLLQIDFLKKERDEKEFEKQLENLNTLLKTKDDEINRLKKIKPLPCTKSNVFPTLIMKEDRVIQKKTYFRAKTFELLNDADIFDSINGEKIDAWKEKSLFTSNVKTQDWIKITGHFVQDKWKRSKKELWIKIKNTKQR